MTEVLIALLLVAAWLASKCFNIDFEGDVSYRRIRKACPPCPPCSCGDRTGSKTGGPKTDNALVVLFVFVVICFIIFCLSGGMSGKIR